jgi:sec-independent protein translocase protein TatA
MGGLSLMHWAVVLIVMALLFGRGRFSAAMIDLGHGLRNLRDGLADGESQANSLRRLD